MKSSVDEKIVVLEGSPKERGYVHGTQLKSQITEVIERWKYQLLQISGINPDKLIAEFMENTNFLTAVKKWTPHLLEEVEGIADGAGIEFDAIFALQCGDEEWWYSEFVEQQSRKHCSALGSFKDDQNPALLAQTMDISSIFQGLEVLQYIKNQESSLKSFVLTFAGMIALCGVNNRPVGICCNSLVEDLKRSIDGLPVAFIVRAVLEQSTLENAIEFIQTIKHASGQNYMMGDAKRVVSFECSANKVVQYIPHAGAQRLYHTNHPLANDDFIIPSVKKVGGGTTHARFNYLEYRVNDSSKQITVENIKYILSSHQAPICIHHNNRPGEGYTFGAVVYSLSTRPELYLAIGPPCSNKYEKLIFND